MLLSSPISVHVVACCYYNNCLFHHSQHSNLLNQARLTVLKSRDDHVKRIVEEAKDKLDDITKDTPRWKKVLQDLITQVCVCNKMTVWSVQS